MTIVQVSVNPKTLPILDYLDRLTFPSPTSHYFERIDQDEWAWIAWEGKDPIGFLMASARNRTVTLERVGVLPVARGRGLQRRLMAALERRCRAGRIARMVAYTSPDNFPSMNNFIARKWKTFLPRSRSPLYRGLKWVYWRKKIV